MLDDPSVTACESDQDEAQMFSLRKLLVDSVRNAANRPELVPDVATRSGPRHTSINDRVKEVLHPEECQTLVEDQEPDESYNIA
eukprot:3358848-Pyramimonas_sp.AAC.2